MIETVSKIITQDKNTSLFLVDIGVYGFKNILEQYPQRAMNIGIFEDGMIGVAAGLSLSGIIPIVYGISPYICCRAFEQLKLDFGYQKLGGNFITTGASYDFSTLGYSHYCPEDFGLIKMIPGFEFIAPGTAEEFKILFEQSYNNGNPTYFRLSDYPNKFKYNVEFGKANIIKMGSKATVIAVSTILDEVIEACKYEDVTILYYTTLAPFDYEILSQNCQSNKVLLCEPNYYGLLTQEVVDSLKPNAIKIEYVGLPHEIFRNYGTKQEKDIYYGLTVENIKNKLKILIGE